jgi:hypothetical protein
MSEQGGTEDVKDTLAQKFMSRWLPLLAFAVPVGIVNLIYGSL